MSRSRYDLYLGKEIPLNRSAISADGRLRNVTFTLEASIDSLGGSAGPSGYGALLLRGPRKKKQPQPDRARTYSRRRRRRHGARSQSTYRPQPQRQSALEDQLDEELAQFLTRMKKMTTGRPISAFGCEGETCQGEFPPPAWGFHSECNTSVCAGLLQTLAVIAPTATYPSGAGGAPTAGGDRTNSSRGMGMVAVPGNRSFLFSSSGVEIEGFPGTASVTS